MGRGKNENCGSRVGDLTYNSAARCAPRLPLLMRGLAQYPVDFLDVDRLDDVGIEPDGQ